MANESVTIEIECDEMEETVNIDISSIVDNVDASCSKRLKTKEFNISEAPKIWPFHQTKALLQFLCNNIKRRGSSKTHSDIHTIAEATDHINEVAAKCCYLAFINSDHSTDKCGQLFNTSYSKDVVSRKFRNEMYRYRNYEEMMGRGKPSLKPKYYDILKNLHESYHQSIYTRNKSSLAVKNEIDSNDEDSLSETDHLSPINNSSLQIPRRKSNYSKINSKNRKSNLAKRRPSSNNSRNSPINNKGLSKKVRTVGVGTKADYPKTRSIGMNTEESYIADRKSNGIDDIFLSLPPDILEEFAQDIPSAFEATKRKTSYQKNINSYLKEQCQKSDKMLSNFSAFLQLYTANMENINEILLKLKDKLDAGGYD